MSDSIDNMTRCQLCGTLYKQYPTESDSRHCASCYKMSPAERISIKSNRELLAAIRELRAELPAMLAAASLQTALTMEFYRKAMAGESGTRIDKREFELWVAEFAKIGAQAGRELQAEFVMSRPGS